MLWTQQIAFDWKKKKPFPNQKQISRVKLFLKKLYVVQFYITQPLSYTFTSTYTLCLCSFYDYEVRQ